MAKSKDKGGLKVRRVLKKDERRTGGFFMRLKTDEWFKGYALFTPDPEADDNPGYYEYFEHYDKPNNQYVPCAGDDCYMCELGDNPSVRALTLWYFPDNAAGEKLKVLKLNGYMIRDFGEIEQEEGGVLGKRFRVKRLSDKGEYRVSPQTDKPLKKAEIKALLKDAMSEKANENKAGTNAMDFEALTLRQLKAALEKNKAVDSLQESDDDEDDDDEDDEEETPKSKGGKPKSEKSKKSDDEDDDDDEDDEDDSDDDDSDEDDDDDEESDDDDSDDDDEEESEESDDDDEEESDDDDEEDDEDEEGEDEKLSGEKFEVIATSEADETITVKIDNKKVKLWLAEGVDADWDKVVKGAEITVDADKDSEGDFVITKLKVKAAKSDGKKASGGKGGKKKK